MSNKGKMLLQGNKNDKFHFYGGGSQNCTYYRWGVGPNSTKPYKAGGGGVKTPDFDPYVLNGWSLKKKQRNRKENDFSRILPWALFAV